MNFPGGQKPPVFMNPMDIVEIRNLSRSLARPLRVESCASFLCKLRGLTFRWELGEEAGLLMDNRRESRMDSTIHMVGVFIDLGIVWLGEDKKVVDSGLAKRWVSVLSPSHAARYILEVHPARLEEFEIGDEIGF